MAEVTEKEGSPKAQAPLQANVEKNALNSEIENLQRELERKIKCLADTQKWAYSNSRKLKAALKKVNSLVEKGLLADQHSRELLELLESKQPGPEEMLLIIKQKDNTINKLKNKLARCQTRQVFISNHYRQKKYCLKPTKRFTLKSWPNPGKLSVLIELK